jgi:DNA-binding SARP family transcriptional activator
MGKTITTEIAGRTSPAVAAPKADSRLVEAMAAAQGRPLFIMAPRRCGRSSLALDYARRRHRMEDVLWTDCASASFTDAVASGALFEQLHRIGTNSLGGFRLVVFDDLPALPEPAASLFSDQIDLLIERGIETIVISTPEQDCLERHQSDRLLLSSEMLIAGQRWSRSRLADVLDCFLNGSSPVALRCLSALMLLARQGSVGELRALGFEVDTDAHIALRQACPLIDINPEDASFDASSLPVRELCQPLLSLLSRAAASFDDGHIDEQQRSFQRLTCLAIHLAKRELRDQSQLLLELAGMMLAAKPQPQTQPVQTACGPVHGSACGPAPSPGYLDDGYQYFEAFDPFDSLVELGAAGILSLGGGQQDLGQALTGPGGGRQGHPILGRHRLNHSAPSSGQSAPAPPVQTPPLPQVGAVFARTDLGQIDSEDGAEAFIGASLNLAQSGPAPLELRLFGDFEATVSGVRLDGRDLRRSRVRTLLMHLALNLGRGVARDLLLERIWPEKDYPHAKDNFYVTWAKLSHVLADGLKHCPYLQNSHGLCRLDDRLVSTDAHQFEQLSKAVLFRHGSASQRIEAIYQMEQLYRGDILSGCSADPFIQAAQLRYRAILVDVMLEASSLFSEQGNDIKALWFARKAYDTDSSREDVYRVLMAMQDRAGQRTSALQTYFDCKRYLSEELGIMPSLKTRELYQELILDAR